MDWIERLFRLSPDGGRGTLEAGIATGAAAAAVMIAVSALGAARLATKWLRAMRGAREVARPPVEPVSR